MADFKGTIGTVPEELRGSLSSDLSLSGRLSSLGIPGNGIASIEKTSTDGLTDTYTITYDDGATTTYQITNGNGIVSAVFNDDNTLTLSFDDGTELTTGVLRGDDGEKVLLKAENNVVSYKYESDPNWTILVDLTGFADDASNAADRATAKAEEARQSAIRAENSASDANASAGIATTKAEEAASSEEQAGISMRRAETAASDALASKNLAQEAAATAVTAQDNARIYSERTLGYANNAAQSAQSASNSAASAAQSATGLSEAVASAQQSAREAASSATQAQEYYDGIDEVAVQAMEDYLDAHPAVQSVNGKTRHVVLNAEDVGALPDDTFIPSKITDLTNDSDFATNSDLSELETKLNTIADSDDQTLDQLSEIVAYIKNNKNLIDGITTGKVSVSDIVDNLTSSATNKPLSAKQGKVLKDLIDAIVIPTNVSAFTNDAGYLTEHQDISGKANTADLATVATSGNYNDLSNKPTIPTKVSDLTDDSGHYTKPSGGIPASDLADGVVPVEDVQVNGTSVVENGVANVPVASENDVGVVKLSGAFKVTSDERLALVRATNAVVKAGTNQNYPLVPYTQDRSTFYGLAKAAGDTTQSVSDNEVGNYTDSAKTAIKNMLGVPEDPLAVGTALPASADLNSYTTPGNYTADSTVIASITHAPTTTVEYKLTVEQISDEVIKQTVTTTETPANVYQRTGDSSSTGQVFGDWVKEIKSTDYATSSTAGIVMPHTYYGTTITDAAEGKILSTYPATAGIIKAGTTPYQPIVPKYQHAATFYGLAKAAGDTTQSASDNLVGDYTTEAKEAIQEMLDVPSTADKADVITATATGSLVTITDGADNMPVKSAVVTMEPIQDLHGYDNPWLAGGGKNKFTNVGEALDTYLKSDGTVSTSTGWNISDYISVVPSTTYTFTPNSTSGASAYSCFYDDNKNVISSVQSGQQTFTTPENCKFMRFSYRNTSTNIQLELGSEATSYAPYENICPISGRTGLSVVRVGKNLYDAESYPLTEGWIGGGNGALSSATSYYCTKDFIPCSELRNKTITLNHRPGGSNPGIAFYTDKNVCISGVKNNDQVADEPMTVTVPDNAYSYRFTVSANYLDEIQIELGSEATEYEPYRGVTASVNWTTEAGTVYGGTIDLITGKLLVDRAKIILDGTQEVGYTRWREYAGSSAWLYSPEITPGINNVLGMGSNLTSDKLKSIPYVAGDGGVYGDNVGISLVGSAIYGIAMRVPVEGLTTAELINQWLSENPITVAYKLAEPIEYQLSAQQIRTLLGTNNFWSDGDNIELEYSADTKSYVDKNTIDDVQVDRTSIVDNGVANIPLATNSTPGVVAANPNFGTYMRDSDPKTIAVNFGSSGAIKAGTNTSASIPVVRQHESTFYGLAKAAGADMKNSSNAVGAYTDEAKIAINKMIGSYGLNLGEAIPTNADLNTYTTPGAYNADSTVIASITNAPTTTETYKLVVATVSETVIEQIVTAANGKVYRRTGDSSSSSWTFSSWVKDISSADVASTSTVGVVKIGDGFSNPGDGTINVDFANADQIKAGSTQRKSITPYQQHRAVFYGLAKAAGEDMASSSNAVGTYTNDAKSAIRTMLGAVGDVQLNSTSVVENGVANIPIMTQLTMGVAKLGQGLTVNANNQLQVNKAFGDTIKNGGNEYQPIVPVKQHESVFYGLAKAAGSDMKDSSNAVGTYTDAAKSAIKTMLGVPTDTYDLNLGADIPANADLNAYTTPGTYNADTTVISGIVNAPTTTETYKLVVESIDDDLIRQTAISKSHVYQRTGDVSTSSWVFTDWVQNITSTDYATYESGGAVRVGGDGLAIMYGKLYVQRATDAEIKACGNGNKPIVPLTQNAATFYGLAKAAGDTTQALSDNAVGTYTNDAKTAIRSMLGAIGTEDYATATTGGVVKITAGAGGGINLNASNQLIILKATSAQAKAGTDNYHPIVPYNEHEATFYGLAKAAGDTTQSTSSNAVGTYTQEAKTAIQTMLGVTVPEAVGSCVEYISDSSVTIVGEPNTRYVCGEVTSISITPPAVGTIDVTFTSGSTIAILTLPSTVKMPEWWGGVEAGYTYELVITDGVYAGVMAWPQ